MNTPVKKATSSLKPQRPTGKMIVPLGPLPTTSSPTQSAELLLLLLLLLLFLLVLLLLLLHTTYYYCFCCCTVVADETRVLVDCCRCYIILLLPPCRVKYQPPTSPARQKLNALCAATASHHNKFIIRRLRVLLSTGSAVRPIRSRRWFVLLRFGDKDSRLGWGRR